MTVKVSGTLVLGLLHFVVQSVTYLSGMDF